MKLRHQEFLTHPNAPLETPSQASHRVEGCVTNVIDDYPVA